MKQRCRSSTGRTTAGVLAGPACRNLLPEPSQLAGVVEQDDLAVAGERVTHSRVVVIQGAHEVLEEHQRRSFGDPETAVREAYSAALSVLGGGRVLRERSHDASVPPGRA